MVRLLALVLAGLMIAVGVIWTFQGLGYLEGSPMTGETTWSVIGPALAGFGVALGFVAFRGPR